MGVPGLAKTLLVNTVAQALGLSFNRIQFTPDLMPSDIVGSEILDESRQFKFVKGPLFSNIVLADEINRTPPKTQAALLEAMQERAVTAAGQRYPLPGPSSFSPRKTPSSRKAPTPSEAQLDRFMFNTWVDYPSFDEEVNVVSKRRQTPPRGESRHQRRRDFRLPTGHPPHACRRQRGRLCREPRRFHPPGPDRATAEVNQYLSWGAGPRASQYLIVAAKVNAALNGNTARTSKTYRPSPLLSCATASSATTRLRPTA